MNGNYEGFIDGTPMLNTNRLETGPAPITPHTTGAPVRVAGGMTFPPLAERRALNELLVAILERYRREFTTTE
ncbi:MAG: hypothetical protein HY301_04865 [Verrucomicrobia bacterium]|nr:hypothetical protein [Verrucomicrobiota bacterium]